MKQIGASLLERKYAASISLKAAVHRTEDVLTVATRGLGFALDRTLYLDGRTDPSNKQLLGATALKTRTAWSEDQKQLVETLTRAESAISRAMLAQFRLKISCRISLRVIPRGSFDNAHRMRSAIRFPVC